MTDYGAGENRSGINWTAVKIGLPVLALVAYFAWRAFSTTTGYGVFFVNGTTLPYDISVDDQTVTLQPNSVERVELPMGEHIVLPSGIDGLPAVDLSLDVPLGKRLLNAETIVVNPDGLAILVEEETVYTAEDQPEYEGELDVEVHVAASQYRLTGINYVFREFPDAIQLGNTQDSEFKRRLYQFVPDSALGAFDVLSYNFDPVTVGQYGRKFLAIYPGDSRVVFMLAGMLPETEYLEMLENRLEDRPIRVDWHRAYQNAMERAGRSAEIVGRYTSMLEAEPDNPQLTYLTGRITPQTDRARALFSQAESTPAGPIGYGYHALAYGDVAAGRFDSAYDNARLARAATPDHADFDLTYTNALQATGRWADLAELLGENETPLPDQGENVAARIRYLTAAGRHDAAGELADAFLEAYSREYGEEDAEQWRTYIAAIEAYVKGDLESYTTAISELLGTEGQYRIAVLEGNAQRSNELFAELGFDDLNSHLLLFAVAQAAGDTAMAEVHLAASLEQLRAGDADERLAAGILENGTDDASQLRELVMFPERKRVYLVAFGLRHPGNRAQAHALATRLNYSPVFPQRALQRIIEKSG